MKSIEIDWSYYASLKDAAHTTWRDDRVGYFAPKGYLVYNNISNQSISGKLLPFVN
jgi:hypothetical protein